MSKKGESEYKYAWKLFNSASAIDDMEVKKETLNKAHGAAYLAFTLEYIEALELLSEIEKYAEKFGIDL